MKTKTIEVLKHEICRVIDNNRAKIIDIGEKIKNTPELGFKEHRTARLVTDLMNEYSIPHQTELAVTGVKGALESDNPGPTVALLGELDSILVANHPDADPKTGAAHACGHNAQIAGMMGAMMGLVESNVMPSLAGSVVFFAVPAEEYVEVEYRMALVRQGKIGLLGGKPELIRLGHFNDIDMAIMIHTHSSPDFRKAVVCSSSNGCVVKLIRFEGKAAHAGIAPECGINALNAANIAMSAINAQRETFKDDDTIRVHPIITRGGDLVNVVPADVGMETYVRGKSIDAILDADMKVNRSLKAGAIAVGGNVVIETLPGYFPLKNDPGLASIFKDNCLSLLGEDEYQEEGHRTGSTDMGDVSQIMPALHPFVGGAQGGAHSADYQISDPDLAYIVPSKLLAMSVIDLLYGSASAARKVIKNHKPQLSKEDYLEFQKRIFKTEIYKGPTNCSDIKSSVQ